MLRDAMSTPQAVLLFVLLFVPFFILFSDLFFVLFCSVGVLCCFTPQVGLLKSLQSPNIVKLHTCFLQSNVLWVVMEWVDGGDLKGELVGRPTPRGGIAVS